MGHRPLAGGIVVVKGEPFAAMWQIYERTRLHALADLPLDEALPAVGGLATTIGVAALRTHCLMVAGR